MKETQMNEKKKRLTDMYKRKKGQIKDITLIILKQ